MSETASVSLMAITVALLSERLSAVCARKRLQSSVNAQVVFQTTEPEELKTAARVPARPLLVHPSCERVSSVIHRVLITYDRLEALVACFSDSLPL